MNVFFKTNHLSEDFVLLSVERWQLLKTPKTQFLQLFRSFHPIVRPTQIPIIFPFQGGILRTRIPNQLPHELPIISPFRDIIYGRIPTQIPANSPAVRPYRGKIRGDFRGRILLFLLKFNGFSVSFRPSRHGTGEVLGDRMGGK